MPDTCRILCPRCEESPCECEINKMTTECFPKPAAPKIDPPKYSDSWREAIVKKFLLGNCSHAGLSERHLSLAIVEASCILAQAIVDAIPKPATTDQAVTEAIDKMAAALNAMGEKP